MTVTAGIDLARLLEEQPARAGPDLPRELPTTFVNELSRRARPDSRLRQRPSSKGMEFEDPPTFGRFDRTVDIDPIDGANEPGAERYASRERAEDVAKEPDPLRGI